MKQEQHKGKDQEMAQKQGSPTTSHSSFPWQLHDCLIWAEKEGMEHVISWQTHGRSFFVHKPDKFVHTIMPR